MLGKWALRWIGCFILYCPLLAAHQHHDKVREGMRRWEEVRAGQQGHGNQRAGKRGHRGWRLCSEGARAGAGGRVGPGGGGMWGLGRLKGGQPTRPPSGHRGKQPDGMRMRSTHHWQRPWRSPWKTFRRTRKDHGKVHGLLSNHPTPLAKRPWTSPWKKKTFFHGLSHGLFIEAATAPEKRPWESPWFSKTMGRSMVFISCTGAFVLDTEP